MAVKRAMIEKTPSSMHVNQGADRKNADVEAERGETMITRDDTSNRKKLVGIGGKKHGEGGTPLAVPGGTAIFSDRLKIKDPVLLKFFNESGKKEKTFADISKKYDITKYQEELDNEDNDNITNDSLTKNMNDANFKLSALFTVQEFHEKKGSPDEHSSHFEPFMERMQLSPSDIFGSGQQEPQFAPIPQQAYGGLTRYSHGGEHPDETTSISQPPAAEQKKDRSPGESMDWEIEDNYSKEAVDYWNKKRAIYKLPPIPDNKIGVKSFIDAAAGEFQKASLAAPDILEDYILNQTNDPGKSDRPTNKTQRLLWQKGLVPADGKSFTNVDIQGFRKDNKIDRDFLFDGYVDNLASYRAPYTNVKTISASDYDFIFKDVTNKWTPGPEGLQYRFMGNGLYEGYKKNADGTYEKVEVDADVMDDPYKWNTTPLDDRQDPRNMDFRWDHKRALAQAVKNKTNIPRLAPFTPTPDTQYVDQAYYNPDQMISAIESMVQGQGQKQAMHAGPQGQLANFLAGQQFDVMGKTIGEYEDKNVQAYNQEQLTNTNIANAASERLTTAIQGHHDKNTILKQEYANARTNADNNIAENEIAMWTERKNRMNLEATIGEQYRTDPNTGLHAFNKGKDFTDKQASTEDLAATWGDIKHKYPTMPDAEITDLVLAMHSGKYEVQRNDNVAPNEANYKN